jgi:hypothetical protein
MAFCDVCKNPKPYHCDCNSGVLKEMLKDVIEEVKPFSTNPDSKPRELYLYIDEIDEGRRKLDLGESMVINMTMYPRKDEMPFLTKVVEISALHAANERVKELESVNRELVGALEYYADMKNKVHVSKIAENEDEEIGNFVLPFSDHECFVGTEYKGEKYYGFMSGKLARKTLAEIEGEK